MARPAPSCPASAHGCARDPPRAVRRARSSARLVCGARAMVCPGLAVALVCHRCADDSVLRLCGCCAGPSRRGHFVPRAREPPVPLRSRAPLGHIYTAAGALGQSLQL